MAEFIKLEKRMYTTTEVARLIGKLNPEVRNLCKRNHIKWEMSKDDYIALYPYESVIRLIEIARKNKEKAIAREQKKATVQKDVKKTLEELQAEHPLVKDIRFFKTSYFPEVVPECFKEEIND